MIWKPRKCSWTWPASDRRLPGGIAEQIDVRFSQGHPQLLGQHSSIERLIHLNQRRWKKTLAVEISYSLEAHNIHFDLLLLFTEDSIKRLTNKINYLMN